MYIPLHIYRIQYSIQSEEVPNNIFSIFLFAINKATSPSNMHEGTSHLTVDSIVCTYYANSSISGFHRIPTVFISVRSFAVGHIRRRQ